MEVLLFCPIVPLFVTGIIVQVDKVVVLWTANTERYSNVSLQLLHCKAKDFPGITHTKPAASQAASAYHCRS